MIRVLAVLILVVIAAMGAGKAFIVYLELPTVAQSFSTGKCVRVYGDGGFNCDNLPSKYIHVWVK